MTTNYSNRYGAAPQGAGRFKIRQTKTILSALLALSFFLVPAFSFSAVKVVLSNGREFIADSCKEEGGKLVCEKLGGSFEMDKKDVAGLEAISVGPNGTSGKQEEQAESTEKKREDGAADQNQKDTMKTDEGVVVKGLSPEAEKRLARINMRKRELQKDKESLIKDRDQLYEDVKNSGVIRSQAQLDGMKKRISGLEERINGFNKEVDALNAEEKELVEGTKNR